MSHNDRQVSTRFVNMVREFKISTDADICEMHAISRGMRRLLSRFASGRIPSREYRVSDLKRFCESLVRGQRNDIRGFKPGSWCLAPTAEMPEDARVEFVFFPTYLAVAILTLFRRRYPDFAREIQGFDKALLAGMQFCTYRGLEGHGYQTEKEKIDAFRTLLQGGVLEYLTENPSVCPELLRILRGIDERLRTGCGQSSACVKVGDRVRLIHTDDPSGLRTGDEGEVILISEISDADVGSDPELRPLAGRSKIWVEWDRGGRLALIEGVDRFEIIPDVARRR